MINGAHVVIYTTDPEADRNFIADIFDLPTVDVGDGWLIFGLPASEMAFHPSTNNNVHEFYFMCEDIDQFLVEMQIKNVSCGPVVDEGWGLITSIHLPGGGKLGVYEPRHARPQAPEQ